MKTSLMSERLGQGRLPFIIIVVLVLVIGLPLLFYPFGRDQGEVAHVTTQGDFGEEGGILAGEFIAAHGHCFFLAFFLDALAARWARVLVM